MKKIIIFIFAISIFASCQKEETTTVSTEEVVFSGLDNGSGQKSTEADPCDNALADYAKVVIGNTIHRPAVFYIGGVAHTQAIKLIPSEYTIEEFILYNDKGTPDNRDDDFIVKAAPMFGSTYANFVATPLAFTFQVEAFKKAEVPVEVLCFEEKDYESFGFNWFAMTEITVKEQVFFGDICVDDLTGYENSMYNGQANGIQLDMPAIFKIDVYRNGAFVISYSNEVWLGEGEPLKVRYPDHDNAADVFDFELSILVKEESDFVFKHYYTWTLNDDEMINAGDDGVVDFVLGDCIYGDTDLQLEWTP